MQSYGKRAEESTAAPKIALAYVRRRSRDDARYLAAIAQSGGTPVPLWEDESGWEGLLAGAAGLLLTGGGDIDPRIFGRAGSDGCLGIDEARDAREMAAFRIAEKARLPVLGICRGMQLINVAYSAGGHAGALLEDLSDTIVRHRPRVDKTSAFHEVAVRTGTRLSQALGRAGLHTVNSRHHQGLSEEHLARGLVVSATAADGIVEGLEAPGDWFLTGVQCHPERSAEVPELAGIVRALILAAERRYARQ